MKRSITGLVCAAVLCAGLLPVGAMAAKLPKKKVKQGHEQKLDLKAGLKSGKITKEEVKAYKADRKAAKADGKITPEEKARLQAERNKLLAEINGQK